MLSKELLHELFEYNDGNLFWKKSRGTRKAGSKAGTIHRTGYVHIQINRQTFLAHRLIWLMRFGNVPHTIDHIDTNKSNNRIENLREATTSENCFNSKKRIHNTSGIKNVSFDKKTQKWEVRLRIDGKQHFFGRYHFLDEAKLVAEEKRKRHHKDFAYNG